MTKTTSETAETIKAALLTVYLESDGDLLKSPTYIEDAYTLALVLRILDLACVKYTVCEVTI